MRMNEIINEAANAAQQAAIAIAKKKKKAMAEDSGKRCMQCGMINCKCPGDSCKCKPIKGWVPGKGFKKAMEEAAVNEKWSQKYKSSINCSHPKGFSQRAHCAGKKKHDESIEMESVCPDCGMCETHGDNLLEIKQRLDAKCWKGKHKEGTKIKGGIRVNNCVPNESIEEEAKHGLYYNVNKRKKAGTSRPASSPKAPTAQAWKDAAKTAKKEGVAEGGMPASVIKSKQRYSEMTPAEFAKAHTDKSDEELKAMAWRHGYGKDSTHYVNKRNKGKESVAEGLDDLARILELSGLNLTADEQFDIIEEMVEQVALDNGVDPEVIWEDFESVDDDELLESAAWHRSAGKSKKGGLNAKGVASYRREHPGSKLQMAVTTKPSKLKAGSKAAKRRKSFCARMGGVKGPMKKPNGKPTRKALALRKWNC